jgi:hypothetical protein
MQWCDCLLFASVWAAMIECTVVVLWRSLLLPLSALTESGTGGTLLLGVRLMALESRVFLVGLAVQACCAG